MAAARRAKKAGPARKRPAKPTRADAELIKMSELSKRSGTPAPTIKHYIREGLLPGPEVRTSRNMAYYDGRLSARIVVIKELQAERFLPLRVIGELLEPAPSDKIRPELDAVQRRGEAARPSVQRRKRSEVMKTFGVSRAELDSLEQAGVLELRGEGETAGYSGTDLELLDILADVRRLGLGELFPITVAVPYLAAVKKLVEFEIGVFRDALSREVALSVDEVAAASMQLGQRLVIALRAKLLPVGLAT